MAVFNSNKQQKKLSKFVLTYLTECSIIFLLNEPLIKGELLMRTKQPEGSRELTKKQRRVYDYIVKYMSLNSYPPSIREICADLGYSSPSSAFFALKEIRDRGYIEISEGKKRAITLVGDKGAVKVPLLVKVGEGPRITGSAPMSYIYYVTEDKTADYFAVILKDDAMSGAGIFNGDTIIARRQNLPDDGDIIVVMAGGDVTVRRASRKGKELVFKAEDGKTEDIPSSGCYVLGKVCSLQRVY